MSTKTLKIESCVTAPKDKIACFTDFFSGSIRSVADFLSTFMYPWWKHGAWICCFPAPCSKFAQLPTYTLGCCPVQPHWCRWELNALPKGCLSDVMRVMFSALTFSHCAKPDACTNTSAYWLWIKSNCCISHSDSILVKQNCTLRISLAKKEREAPSNGLLHWSKESSKTSHVKLGACISLRLILSLLLRLISFLFHSPFKAPFSFSFFLANLHR